MSILYFFLYLFLPCVIGQNSGVGRESIPYYNEVPTTNFRCEDQSYAGYYSDPETDCQVFHICVRRNNILQQYSFLCPNETVFDQELLVCVWYDGFDCSTATSLYYINEAIFEDSGEGNRGRQFIDSGELNQPIVRPRGRSAFQNDNRIDTLDSFEDIQESREFSPPVLGKSLTSGIGLPKANRGRSAGFGRQTIVNSIPKSLIRSSVTHVKEQNVVKSKNSGKTIQPFSASNSRIPKKFSSSPILQTNSNSNKITSKSVNKKSGLQNRNFSSVNKKQVIEKKPFSSINRQFSRITSSNQNLNRNSNRRIPQSNISRQKTIVPSVQSKSKTVSKTISNKVTLKPISRSKSIVSSITSLPAQTPSVAKKSRSKQVSQKKTGIPLFNLQPKTINNNSKNVINKATKSRQQSAIVSQAATFKQPLKSSLKKNTVSRISQSATKSKKKTSKIISKTKPIQSSQPKIRKPNSFSNSRTKTSGKQLKNTSQKSASRNRSRGRKPSRVSSNRAVSNFDILHALLKNVTVIRSEALLKSSFGGSRRSFKRNKRLGSQKSLNGPKQEEPQSKQLFKEIKPSKKKTEFISNSKKSTYVKTSGSSCVYNARTKKFTGCDTNDNKQDSVQSIVTPVQSIQKKNNLHLKEKSNSKNIKKGYIANDDIKVSSSYISSVNGAHYIPLPAGYENPIVPKIPGLYTSSQKAKETAKTETSRGKKKFSPTKILNPLRLDLSNLSNPSKKASITEKSSKNQQRHASSSRGTSKTIYDATVINDAQKKSSHDTSTTPSNGSYSKFSDD